MFDINDAKLISSSNLVSILFSNTHFCCETCATAIRLAMAEVSCNPINADKGFSMKRLFNAITCTAVIMLIAVGSGRAFAHDEYHDRYVHTGGSDTGDCKKASAPCATIEYALTQAQKGESVRVAKGTYRFERDDPAEAITLLGPVVNVLGGYSTTDGFAQQDTNANPTNIVGPTQEYAKRFAERGFNLVTAAATTAASATDATPSHFVTEDGTDAGVCASISEPCGTLAYAIDNAANGDVIAIAEGTFVLAADDLTDANTRGVRLQGGYTNSFEFADPELNRTYVTGPSHDNRDLLASMGLVLIQDAKGEEIKNSALDNGESALAEAAQITAATACVDGFAGSFPCDGIDMLSRLPLSDFSSRPSSANDIWGFVDQNDQREYALIGFNNGVAVVDVSDPQNPREVGTVSGSNARWRDIKVYQFFDDTLGRYRAYAYSTADFPARPQGLQVIDLTDLPNSISLAGSYDGINRAHNVYMANIDYATGEALSGSDAYIYILGADTDGGRVQILDVDNPASPRLVTGGPSGATYTHDATNILITDSRVSQCPSGRNPCELFVGYDEDSLSIWDVSEKSNPIRLSDTTYSGARYTHSGWWSKDKQFLFIQDEGDESAGANTTLYTVNISDLRNPSIQRSWTGPTRAIDHNGFTLGDRYYMSNYRRGLTVLDVTDPNRPRDDAFFDTFPSPANNTASFDGAWGVYPYLPSGTLLVSDISNGLFLLKDGDTSEPPVDPPPVTRSTTLQNNLWSLLSIPANASTQSIEQLFGDNLPVSSYGQTWAIFTFDPQSQSFVAPPSVNSTLAQGIAFWMIQSTGADVTIDLPGDVPDGDAQNSTACASLEGCFSAPLSTSATVSRWSLIGAPYASPVDISNIRVLSSTGSCSQGCDLAQAKSEGLLLSEQWIYNTSGGAYEALSGIDSLQPWQGFWINSAAAPAGTELTVLFPKPE